MKVRDKFATFEELQAAVEQYSEEKLVQFYIRDCRSIDAARTRIKRYLNDRLGKYRVHYCCVRGGKSTQSRSTGKRNTSTAQAGCPAFIKCRASDDGNYLEVIEMDATHNHVAASKWLWTAGQTEVLMMVARAAPCAAPLAIQNSSAEEVSAISWIRPVVVSSSSPSGDVDDQPADESCSHEAYVGSRNKGTQAAVSTATTGSQCDDPRGEGDQMEAESQTEAAFPGAEADGLHRSTSCLVCGKYFTSQNAMNTHWHLMHGKKPQGGLYYCSHCPYSNKKRRAVKVHERIHTSEKPLVCRVCQKRFRRTRDLVSHQRLHTAENHYGCRFCPKRFPRKSALSVHEKMHCDEMPYACRFCEKRYPRKTALVIHERVHTGEKPYACRFCRERFPHITSRMLHERVHTGGELYKCRYCPKLFRWKESAVSHERMHTGDTPYICTVCRKPFPRKRSLVTHMSVHTGEKPFVCSICKKGFREKGSLVRHEMVHSGKKPHVCSFCQRGFSRKKNLITHESAHTGNKLYICTVCRVSFPHRATLVEHQKIHMKESQFECTDCGQLLSCKFSLVRHSKLHNFSSIVESQGMSNTPLHPT